MEPWIRWLAAPVVMVAAPVHAVQYLTAAQAQQALYPAATRFERSPLELSAAQVRAIEDLSGQRVRSAKPEVWQAFEGARPAGWFFVDQVIGKHEFITYAL